MPQQTTGTSRNQRSDHQLLDRLCQIDNKSVEDLLGYIQKYLGNINYFNLKNVPDGNWSEILQQTPLFYMVGILNYPIASLKSNTANLRDLNDWYQRIIDWRNTLSEMGESKLSGQISDLIGDPVFQSQATIVRMSFNAPPETPETARPLFGYPSYVPPVVTPVDRPDPENIIPDFLKIVLQIRKYTSDQLKEDIHTKSDHNPNIAIYVAFMELYKNLQDQINTLPRRHLDFYYQDVLKQSPLPGTPVSAYVYFQLLPTVASSRLDKNALISAGKLFGSKTDILFETTSPLKLYQAEIANIRTLYFNKSPFVKIGTDQSIVSNIVLNPLVQNGQVLTSSAGTAVFGADPATIFNPQTDPEKIGQMGFILGSPVLSLSEGSRQITLDFQLADEASVQLWSLLGQIAQHKSQSVADAFVQVFESAFNISCTTAAGWVPIDMYAVSSDQAGNSFTVSLELAKTFPAVDAIKVKSDPDSPELPALRFALNPFAPVYAFSFLENLLVFSVRIGVAVQEIKNLTVYNNFGMLSVDKPFAVFGTAPAKDAYVMVGKAELFQKQIDSLTVQFEWQGIPTIYGGFNAYYAGYSQTFDNESFQVQSSVLSNGYWVPANSGNVPTANLFETESCVTPAGYESVVLRSESIIPVAAFTPKIPADRQLQEPLLYTNNQQGGFFKLTLVSPDAGFGSQIYQQDYTSVAIYNAKYGTQVPYPNAPYIPVANSISLSYEASDLLEFSALSMKNSANMSQPQEFMHVSPLGIERQVSQTATGTYLITDFKGAGYLYFDLNGMPVQSFASLYFHFVQSNPEVSQSSAILWEYLDRDTWHPLDTSHIIHDGTTGFTRSGIIELLLPELGPEFQPDLFRNYTFRIYAAQNPYTFPALAGIYPNAVKATCTSTDPQVMGNTVTAGQLLKMSGIYPDLKAVIQPFDSFGGTQAEKEIYTRVSERLHHKNRALTAWDYERLVLEKFSNVGIVKCTRLDQSFREMPGQANLILIENTWTVDNPTYFSIDELQEITDFLKACANPFTQIRVMNPIVETLLVNCVVEFEQEDAGGYYFDLVNQEIVQFLSPVSRPDGASGIGGSMTTGMLLGHLENLPYLKAVKHLTIEHICRNGADTYKMIVYKVDEKIRAATPWSILVPTQQNIIRTGDVPVFEQAGNPGIGDLELGLDFILGEKPFSGKIPEVPAVEHPRELPNSILVFKRNF